MELKMEVYTPGLALLGILEKFQSVIWEEKAFTAGSFSIEALLTDGTKPLLKEENIIWIEGGTAGIIEHYDKQANIGAYITVKGRLLTGILERRILWGRYNISGTPAEIMHYLVGECAVNPTRGDVEARKIPGLVLTAPPAGGAAIRKQQTGGYLLDTLEEIGRAYQVAFGVRFNPAVPQMEFWTRWGANRSIHQSQNEQVFYSTELNDVLSSEYSYDSIDWRNVALVAGEGEGSARKMVTVEESVPETPDVPAPPPVPPQNCVITLSVDPQGGGAASGGGSYEAGKRVSLTALPFDGFTFSAWKENGETVSTDRTYTFTASASRSLTAVFAEVIPVYTVAVGVDPDGSGTASGGGSYERGQSVTVTAAPGSGYVFAAWKENGSTVSESASYTFTASGNRSLTAVFAVKPSRLPAGYTEVEYIVGGAASNTNYRPYFYIPATSGAKRLKFAFSCSTTNLFNQSSPYYVVARNASTSTATNGLVWYGFGCQSNHFHANYGSRANQIDVANITPQRNVKYDVDINGPAKTCTINGVVTSAYSATWMAAQFGVFYPFQVNSSYHSMTSYALYPVTLYYLQLLDADGNLLRDLVPCKNSAGVAGFYDVVKNVFFKNENTFSTNSQNVFTPGPAV